MTDLSPKAQAVYEAATTAAIRDNADWPVTIAAALRAAASQLTSAKAAGTLRYIAQELETHQ